MATDDNPKLISLNERMDRATTPEEYHSARKDYQMEQLLTEVPMGPVMRFLGSTLVGCWIAVTVILVGYWHAVEIAASGEFFWAGTMGIFTSLFGLSWWVVNRYTTRSQP
jgi:hypothetical protein